VTALVRHPLIDEILDARREYARGDAAAFPVEPRAANSMAPRNREEVLHQA
jgi:hypothetical protein